MKREWRLLLFSVAFCLLMLGSDQSYVHAANKNSDKFYQQINLEEKGMKVGKKTFINCYVEKKGYQLVVSQKGIKSIFIQGMDKYMYTNGRYLYYATNYQETGALKNNVVRVDLKTGKKTRLITGTHLSVRGAFDNYVYYGRDNDTMGIDLFAYNTKTKLKNHMMKGAEFVLAVTNKRVLVKHYASDVDNYMAYSFKTDGTNKKKFVKLMNLYIKNSYVYYVQMDDVNYSDTYQLIRCNSNLKTKKCITEYVSYEELQKVLKQYKLIN